VLNKKVITLFLIATALVIEAAGQESKTVTKISGSGAEVHTYRKIPEATEPCLPAECEWWKRLRQAGNELQRKGDDKSQRRFVTLFVEGLENSYRVPVKDRPAQPLTFGPMVRVSGVNGTVQLSVEFLADASVGEVSVIKGVGKAIDQSCIQSARQILFLPAIKDGLFVNSQQKPVYNFRYNPNGRR
jgi:hypothetical protein